MWYLTIIISLLLLIYHYDYCGQKKYRLKWYIVILIAFVLTAGLRYRLGTDTITYDREFPELPSLSEFFYFDFDKTRYGKGYLFFNAIARSISDNFVVMQIVQSTFINIVIFYFFYKNTKNIFTCVLLYSVLAYFDFNFEIIRESCAVAVFLIGWKYFKTNQWVKYYLLVVLAILFHPSALVTAIVPLFYLPIFRPFFTFGKKFVIVFIIVFVISTYLSVKFYDLIRLIQILDTQSYADSYENSKLGGSLRLGLSEYLFYFLRYMAYPILGIYAIANKRFIRNSYEGHNTGVKLEYMTCWYVYIAIVTLFINLFLRFNNYFILFVVVTVADVAFSKIRTKKTILKLSFGIWALVLCPYFILPVYAYFNRDPQTQIVRFRRYYPYESVLNPVTDKEREEVFIYYNK